MLKIKCKKLKIIGIIIPAFIVLMIFVLFIAGRGIISAHIGILPFDSSVEKAINQALSKSFDTISNVNFYREAVDSSEIIYKFSFDAEKNGSKFSGESYVCYKKRGYFYKMNELNLGDVKFNSSVPLNQPDDNDIKRILSQTKLLGRDGTVIGNASDEGITYSIKDYDANTGSSSVFVKGSVDYGTYNALVDEVLYLEFVFNKESLQGEWKNKSDHINADISLKNAITDSIIKNAIADNDILLNKMEIKYLKGENITEVSNINVYADTNNNYFKVIASVKGKTDAYVITSDISIRLFCDKNNSNNLGYSLADKNISASNIIIDKNYNAKGLEYSGKYKISSYNDRYDIDDRPVSIYDLSFTEEGNLKFKLKLNNLEYEGSAFITDNGILKNVNLIAQGDYWLKNTYENEAESFKFTVNDISGLIDDYGNYNNNITGNVRFVIYDDNVETLDGIMNLTKK